MADKDAIRTRLWDRLERDGIARFPFPPHGRISNFDGARAAAERAMALPELASAAAVKANPDAPQLPLRRRLLKNGTTVYMAVPRLAEAACFVELDPAELSDLDAAPTVSHMDDHGTRLGPDALPKLDAIVVGSVAVDASGARIGKGEGYSDLEYAILREFGLVDDDTTTVTTVHDTQVVEETLTTDAHDVPIDVVCTPTRTIRTDAGSKPAGIDWSALDEARREEIPILDRLAP
ncbi:MAG: 5-formyltetrahydrofolate cyclo-ligase [Natronomonas sp.]|jgi:5-formyltetrahydrofolate cyclo-ligase|uniref:5-formyltetrahydrofolate cyclo-ligase n=1 Tax=Natronomonas sp. TaxID=2184060 RepID=UPI00286FF961|nr:5-formyltetrahydrofolate cyclo-ligase [Natronomonas sp.]MDR9382286.1 5-formyltetrahydrofolate cyclo-ligase [Natronomonas sp.]MDR9431210.1 5-formyltetrahydrofolate cyclo-ligase [Natronomonas sp.]